MLALSWTVRWRQAGPQFRNGRFPKTAPFVVVFVATHVLRVKTLEVIKPLKGPNSLEEIQHFPQQMACRKLWRNESPPEKTLKEPKTPSSNAAPIIYYKLSNKNACMSTRQPWFALKASTKKIFLRQHIWEDSPHIPSQITPFVYPTFPHFPFAPNFAE